MLRAVLLGLLSMSVVGCKSDADTAKVAPSATAGKVVEVSGTVSVYLGGDGRTASRPLHLGDVIGSEETIETGNDGRVSIELAHNLVRVDLPPNTHKRLTETLGWNAPRKNENAKPTDQDTSAAGRPVERAAADTPDTANTEKKEEAAPAPSAAAPPAVTAAPQPKGGPPSSGGPPLVEAAPRPPPPPPAPRDEERPKYKADTSIGGKDSAREVPGGGDFDKKIMPPAKVAAPRAASDSVQTESARGLASVDPAEQGNALLNKHRAALVACLAHDSAATSFVVHVDPSGKVSLDRGSLKVKASEFTCVQRVLKTIAFPHAMVDLTLDLKKP